MDMRARTHQDRNLKPCAVMIGMPMMMMMMMPDTYARFDTSFAMHLPRRFETRSSGIREKNRISIDLFESIYITV